ncbi:hypothetical protein BDV19DRAFT_385274 [Aspergillus venezuelensis]
MTTSIPIQTLPPELQCCIIRYLDPTALISLSQTSITFRKLINPTRTQFIERLLALELDERIGGPAIKVSRFGTIDSDKHSPEWEANRWAYTVCLKLLPHYAFRNKALSALAYRKPLRGSTHDQKITSWEPSDGLTRRNRKSLKEIREIKSSQEEKRLRERHGRTTSYHILPRRLKQARAKMQRVLRTKRPLFNAPLYAIYNDTRKERLWTLYRVRCGGCAQWRELRAFRVGSVYPRWCPRDSGRNRSDAYHNWDTATVDQEFLDEMRGNHCYLQEYGREVLGHELVRWLEHLAEKQRGEFAGSLASGYNSLSHRFNSAPKHLKQRIRGLIWDMRAMLDKDSSDMTKNDVVLLRIRREEYMTIGEEIKEWLPRDSSFMKWIDCYDGSEALWIWPKEIGEKIREEGKADVLVDWALGRDEIADS